MRLAFYGRIFNFKPSAGKDIDLPNLDIPNLDKSAWVVSPQGTSFV